MFLYIFEDGGILKTNEVEDVDLDECDAGILSIIDISDPDRPKEYYKGWIDIETIERG